MEAIAASGLRIGVDPLGGASVDYWGAIGERYGLDLTVTNDAVDPTFGFMTLDWDGRIRMDPSSPVRDGPARRAAGQVRPVAGQRRRRGPPRDRRAGRRADEPQPRARGRDLVPVRRRTRLGHATSPSARRSSRRRSSTASWRTSAGGWSRSRWASSGSSDGLVDGSIGFGGEESAGASFLRRDGGVWTTDKDGIIACLLAAELTAKTGRNPAEVYTGLTDRFGAPAYRRIDAPATPELKAALGKLSPDAVTATTLAGDPIVAKLTKAPGNGAPIGGLKVVSEQGWFAARPSGTENVTKLYAESFRGEQHLGRILEEAQAILDASV